MGHLKYLPALDLRHHTPARVSLPTTGNSIATTEVLAFQLAHAQARDAVHATLHLPASRSASTPNSPSSQKTKSPSSNSKPTPPTAPPTSANQRSAEPSTPTPSPNSTPHNSDLAIVIADGLSALAVERNAIPVLAQLLPQLLTANWTIAPITLVQQGRVAIGDPIGQHLAATLSLVLIGERPGLSSPDSLGAYITWHPHPTRTDADRNCLSNIRDAGLSPEAAATRLLWYLQTARTRKITGTALKEGSLELNAPSQSRNQQG